MAAWGNLKNIFEKPRTDSFSPWEHHLPSTSPASSFEMFGEFYHHSSSSTTSSPPSPHQSTAAMPESDTAAAVEIFGELCYAEKSDFCPNGGGEMEGGKVGERMRTYSDVRQRFGGGKGGALADFPPPITTIGSGGKPRVYFESIRKDGRFVLREIRIPKQRLLQAKREDGRLTMRVLRPRDEEVEVKEGDGQG